MYKTIPIQADTIETEYSAYVYNDVTIHPDYKALKYLACCTCGWRSDTYTFGCHASQVRANNHERIKHMHPIKPGNIIPVEVNFRKDVQVL